MANYTSTANVVLSVNGKQAEKVLSSLEKDAKRLEKQLAKAAAAGDKATMKKLQHELNQTNRLMDQLRGSSASVDNVLRRLDKATPKELNKALRQLKNELNGIERGTAAWDAHVAKIKAVKAEIDRVNETMREQQSLSDRVMDWINKWQVALLAVGAAITGLVLAGRKAVNAYAEMEQEMANVRKFTGMTAEEVEIEFVPARVDETEDKYGRCLFLSFSGYDENDSTGTSWSCDPYQRKEEIDNTLYQPFAFQSLAGGERNKKAEYYDRIYVGWWDGAQTQNGKLPHPYVEDIEIAEDWSNFINIHFSLRINHTTLNRRRTVYSINTRQKTTFKFLSDNIPNPRAVFFIKGKKYLCEKMTATFTENGMSQLIKGVFYSILD